MIKDAGMGLLVDFHMSDNWADPGKQCVPVAWQVYTTIAELATAVHDYTKDAITKLIAGGARPDMVQIGNETTPGMLLHVCDARGQVTGNNPVQGAATTAGWPNLGALLKAGVAGVKEVDPGILISFHIDRGHSFSASKYWIDNAIRYAAFDAFGESCYQQYQGDINSIPNTVNGWTTTFAQLVAAYPNLRFFAAEYGPLQRQINDVVFNLPNAKGMGTFNWEPTSRGTWNAAQPTDPAGTTTHALFQRSGNTYTALPDLPLYTLMKTDYASRL
jgi:arabinogalactan endo-1,4-beta-galactosidase